MHFIEKPFFWPVEDMEQRKNAYVEHQHRIYSAAYVGRKVASEAVEYYYFRQHQVTNVTNLKKTLTKDMFNLGVKPYEFIRVLHIYLNIDKVVTRSKVDWKGWLVEEEDPEKAIAREKRHLNDLYQKLTSGLSLIVRGRRRWPVKIMIELTMGSYPGGGADARTQDQVTARRDYERGFLNVLETIRRPVYDTIHAGFEVEVAWNGNKAFTETALSEERNRNERDGSESEDDGYGSACSEEGNHCFCYYYPPNSTKKMYDQELDFFRLSKEEWEKVGTLIGLTPHSPSSLHKAPPKTLLIHIPPSLSIPH